MQASESLPLFSFVLGCGTSLREATGREEWLSQPLLLFQRTQGLPLELAWKVTAVCNVSSRSSNTVSGSRASRCVASTQSCVQVKQSYIHIKVGKGNSAELQLSQGGLEEAA